jgi:hypothetical protein
VTQPHVVLPLSMPLLLIWLLFELRYTARYSRWTLGHSCTCTGAEACAADGTRSPADAGLGCVLHGAGDPEAGHAGGAAVPHRSRAAAALHRVHACGLPLVCNAFLHTHLCRYECVHVTASQGCVAVRPEGSSDWRSARAADAPTCRNGQPIIWRRNHAAGRWDCDCNLKAFVSNTVPPPPKLNAQPASALQARALWWNWTRPRPHDECCWSSQPERCCYDRVPRAQRADTADLECCRPSSRWKQHYQHHWRRRQPALAGQPLQMALQAVHQKRRNSARRTTSSGCALAWCRCVQLFTAAAWTSPTLLKQSFALCVPNPRYFWCCAAGSGPASRGAA